MNGEAESPGLGPSDLCAPGVGSCGFENRKNVAPLRPHQRIGDVEVDGTRCARDPLPELKAGLFYRANFGGDVYFAASVPNATSPGSRVVLFRVQGARAGYRFNMDNHEALESCFLPLRRVKATFLP